VETKGLQKILKNLIFPLPPVILPAAAAHHLHRVFLEAAQAEKHWIRLSTISQLTNQHIDLLMFGGACRVCSAGGNWLLHRGQDFVCPLRVHRACVRYQPRRIVARGT
jgi:hypothetical protein